MLPATVLNNYSWNVFRYLGDYLHLAGIAILLLTIAKNRSVKGLSGRTQLVYFIVFITRYLDLFQHTQTAYLVFFKITYIVTSMITLALFVMLKNTWEPYKDTCNLTPIIIVSFSFAILLTDDYSLTEVLWTFSEFLEGFAMVPQYIFSYRDTGSKDWGVLLFVMALGGYRVFYAANWIYKKILVPQYSDIQSWLEGVIQIAFFLDYLVFRNSGYSMLRSVVLTVDLKIHEMQDQVEMKVLGREKSVYETTSTGELRKRRNIDPSALDLDV
jgi:ER lumen protein retaining receptor